MSTEEKPQIVAPCPTPGCDGDIWARPGATPPELCEACIAQLPEQGDHP